MTAFDYAVLLIVGVSMLISVLRGLVREALALAGWVAAFWVASHYAVPAAAYLPDAIPSETLRVLAGFVGLFLGTLLIATLFTIAIAELVKTLGLSAVDRSLGALFGLARGVLIVLVLVFLAGMTPLPHQTFWRNAMLSAPFEEFVGVVKPWMPEQLAKRISYD
ncbi:MAG: CvpA family protein [Sulfuricella sp.]|nr:CvpA family protein [Sulfuricella sp.]